MLFVVSVTVTLTNLTVIGGLQSGVKLTGSVVTEKIAWPFYTGTSAPPDTSALFTAFGCLPPLLMHCAVAVTTMLTCASSPSPASFPDTVSVPSPLLVAVTPPTKCGLPASATGTAIPAATVR
jgi:hypothetical protein